MEPVFARHVRTSLIIRGARSKEFWPGGAKEDLVDPSLLGSGGPWEEVEEAGDRQVFVISEERLSLQHGDSMLD